MSTLIIDLPPLDGTFAERAKVLGTPSEEEYLLNLVESDCAVGELERVLTERKSGLFASLEPDWKERVRCIAAKRTG